ncbi:MAG: diaminopimelate epimerase, partial [Candidatus Omnitrophota bacterium]|nr:diaminopimelate epimerase [Candidatus Omnitrophota bacterium]
PARGGSASGGKNQKSKIKIETKSGIIEAKVIDKKKVRIKLVNPQQIRLNFNLEIGAKNYKANFINTGVPHVVIFSDRLKNLDVKKIGSAIRHHHNFKPGGTNADFAKIQDKKNISIRTYERGVEEETLACGTGVAAAVLISAGLGKVISPVNVRTKGKEVLKVYFEYEGDFKNVWLEGGAKVVYRGKIEQ